MALPRGDRPETRRAGWGPGLARQALERSSPDRSGTWRDDVAAVARAAGWHVIVPGRDSDPGAPDLLLVRAGRMVAAWTGSSRGLTIDGWRAWLTATGAEAVRWVPADGLAAVEGVLA